MSYIEIPGSNTPDVFDAVQSAALGEINAALGANAGYATSFRPGAAVDSGPHTEGDGLEGRFWSDAASESLTFFNDLHVKEQGAINGGRNGVVHAGYGNYGDLT